MILPNKIETSLQVSWFLWLEFIYCLENFGRSKVLSG